LKEVNRGQESKSKKERLAKISFEIARSAIELV
jgi:hypothetical protein